MEDMFDVRDKKIEKLEKEITDLRSKLERAKEGLVGIKELELSISHDLKKVKYTDDYEVGYCEATKIAQQTLREIE